MQTSVIADDGSDAEEAGLLHQKALTADLDLQALEHAVGEGGMEHLIELDAAHLRRVAPNFKVADLHDISQHRRGAAPLEEDLTAEYNESDEDDPAVAAAIGDHVHIGDHDNSSAAHPHLVLQAAVEKITSTHVLVSVQGAEGANEPALAQLGHGGAGAGARAGAEQGTEAASTGPGLWPIDQVSVPYDYLVYALGSKMPDPLRSSARTKEAGMTWMKQMQKRIAAADSIVVVGGGALGVQYALDIATVHPDKAHNITLLHSRPQLLPNFAPAVHDKVYTHLRRAGVNVILGERLALAPGCPFGSAVRHAPGAPRAPSDTEHVPRHLRTTAGRELTADLLLLCTGQQPNSALLAAFSPSSVDPVSRLVRVGRTLQVCATDPHTPASSSAAHGPFGFTPPCGDCDCFAAPASAPYAQVKAEVDAHTHAHAHMLSRVYAIGDVADAFGAINAGYQAWSMAEVAARNIVRQIRVEEDRRMKAHERSATGDTEATCDTAAVTAAAEDEAAAAEAEALEHFTAQPPMLKLSLGLGSMVFQGLPGPSGDGTKPLVEVRDDPEDMQVKSVWRFMAKASTHDMHR